MAKINSPKLQLPSKYQSRSQAKQKKPLTLTPKPLIEHDYATRFAHAVEMAKSRSTTKAQRGGTPMELAPRGVLSQGGVWYPLPGEVRSCCQGLKVSQSNKFPWALYKHCCSLTHIANFCEVEQDDLRKAMWKDRGYVPTTPKPSHCPECDKTKMFKKGDYICRSCREAKNPKKKMEQYLYELTKDDKDEGHDDWHTGAKMAKLDQIQKKLYEAKGSP